MFTISQFEDINDPILREHWNLLVDSAYRPLFFQRYEWIKSYWENFSKAGERLVILAVYEGPDMVGIFPLKHKKNIFSRCRLFELVGSDIHDYSDFIIKKGYEEKAIKEALNYLSEKFRVFQLRARNLFEDSVSSKYLSSAISTKSINGRRYFEDAVPFIALPKTVDELRRRMKKSLKHNISRRLNRLKRKGVVEFKKCLNLDDALGLIGCFFRQHIKRWESDNGYSAYKFPRWQSYIEGLLKQLFDSSIASIYFLSLNNRPIAVCFAIEYNRRFVYFIATHDIDYADCSPGQVLLYNLVLSSTERKYEIFDFGIGKEAYKLHWPCDIVNLNTFFVFSNANNLANRLLKLRVSLEMFFSLKARPALRKCTIMVYAWRFYKRKQATFGGIKEK